MTPANLAPRFVSYLRVSTAKQGASGLGLEGQRETVRQHLASDLRNNLIREFVEVESGKRDDRPQLHKALELARLTGATLIIAKLDRLSRDAHFLTGLMKAGVEFVACDIPQANKLTITVMAAVAQDERERISERTKVALKAAKARGVKLGNPNGAEKLRQYIHEHGNAKATAATTHQADCKARDLAATLRDLEATGIISARATAKAFNDRGIMTARGKTWDAKAVIRVKSRLQSLG